MKEAHEPYGMPTVVTEISRVKYRCEPMGEARTDREVLCRTLEKIRKENLEVSKSAIFIKIGYQEEKLQIEWYFEDNVAKERAIELLGK